MDRTFFFIPQAKVEIIRIEFQKGKEHLWSGLLDPHYSSERFNYPLE